MPDWKEQIRRRMQPPPAAQANEVVEELSTHLEETYNDLLNRGYAPQAAFERTLQEVDDWDVLCRRISRTKQRRNPMNDRTKRLWLLVAVTWLGASLSVMVLQPGRLYPDLIMFYLPWLATLPLVGAAGAYLAQRGNPVNDHVKRLWLSVTVTWLGTILSLVVLERIDHPELILRRPIPIWFSLPGLATLILVGAAGACLAQRANAPRKTRLVVATSPALLLGIMLLALLPWRVALDRTPWALHFFAIDATNMVVVPGLALLLGALPFLRQGSANSFPLPKDGANASMGPTACLE